MTRSFFSSMAVHTNAFKRTGFKTDDFDRHDFTSRDPYLLNQCSNLAYTLSYFSS